MNTNDNDEKSITETIKSYFYGTYQGDPSQLKNVFHADARITGSVNGEFFDWTLT